MTGSTPLDIFIGLVFIYLTYSLLATLVMEIIATNLGFRARNLKVAIIRMLSDEDGGTLKAFISAKYIGNPGSLAESFYKSHIIKNLSSGSFFSKPSSISSEVFAEALISILGKGENRIEKNLNSFLSNPARRNEIGEQTYDQLKFFWDESGNKDIEQFKKLLKQWYEEMTTRSTGWYKRNVQIILFAVGLAISTLFNVDTIAITEKLSKDKDATAQLIELAKSDAYAEYIEDNSIAKAKLNEAFQELSTKAFETQEILSLSRCGNGASEDLTPCACTPCKKYFYSDFSNFIGCFLSALAISLGAPFWYDLLNRLMQLRASVRSAASTKKNK